MQIHQLRYVREVVRQGFNISAASEVLHTSQPGVSKQIQLLEEELEVRIFMRHGKRLTGITQAGEQILKRAEQVLFELENIKRVGGNFAQEASETALTGTLTIATTHTQARYKLPNAVLAFMQRYPQVKLIIHQGNPSQVAAQVASGEADIGIATEAISSVESLLCLPCYQWNRCIVVPKDHALLTQLPLTLHKIAQYPLITYDYAFTGGSLVGRVFAAEHLQPNIALTAIDADVIKTYVRLGLGVGLLANMAYDEARDEGLVKIDASHLFPPSTTFLGVRRDAYLRDFVYDFIQLLAPDFDKHAVNAALENQP